MEVGGWGFWLKTVGMAGWSDGIDIVLCCVRSPFICVFLNAGLAVLVFGFESMDWDALQNQV